MDGLGKVVGCSTVEATVRQHTQPELDSLRHLEPVQLNFNFNFMGLLVMPHLVVRIDPA